MLVAVSVDGLLNAVVRILLPDTVQDIVIHERSFLAEPRWWEGHIQAPEDEETDCKADDKGQVVKADPANKCRLSVAVDGSNKAGCKPRTSVLNRSCKGGPTYEARATRRKRRPRSPAS